MNVNEIKAKCKNFPAIIITHHVKWASLLLHSAVGLPKKIRQTVFLLGIFLNICHDENGQFADFDPKLIRQKTCKHKGIIRNLHDSEHHDENGEHGKDHDNGGEQHLQLDEGRRLKQQHPRLLRLNNINNTVLKIGRVFTTADSHWRVSAGCVGHTIARVGYDTGHG